MKTSWKSTIKIALQTFTSETISSVSRLAIAQETSNSVSAVGISITRECPTGALIDIFRLKCNCNKLFPICH